MTRLALINREEKRRRLAAHFLEKRKFLETIVYGKLSSESDKYEARLKLQLLPRNANPTRQRNRCVLTGRPRGVFRMFGMCRNKVRELAFSGEIPGVVKASW